MKKTSKLFGAIALSAALAMGTAVPALAAPAAGAGDDIDSTDITSRELTVDADGTMTGDQNTVVKVSTHTSQINVTIPVALPVVADTAGGFGMSPNNYAITNESVPNIEIDGAAWEIVENAKAKWNLADEELEMGDDAVDITVDDGVSAAVAPTMGSLFLSLTPGTIDENDEWTDDADAVSLEIKGYSEETGSGKNKVTKTYTQKGAQNELGWIIKGSGKAANEEEMTLPLHVVTTSSIVAGEQETADVISIVYTVKLA